MSRIGRKSIAVPSGVKVEVKDGVIFIEGPKGKLSREISPRITVEIKDSQIIVKRLSDIKLDKSLHGLHRALIANMVKGVVDGYLKELEIIGVGYKAQMQGNNLSMQLRFSHPVVFSPPEGVNIETPKQNQIVVRGIDKEKVGEMASKIRKACPPEPYKGTGIRFLGEYIKKKIGKAQATSK